MKKIFLSLFVVLFAGVFAHANTVNIINLTSCTFTVSLNGGCGGIVSIPPTGGLPLSFPCTGNGTGAKVAYGLDQVNLLYPSMLTGVSSIVPPCMATVYHCSWAQSSGTADATLVIY